MFPQLGGLMAAKYVWEGAIVPSLLSGAGTWVGCTAREEDRCEELQEYFWRTILQVPKGTPKVMLRAETGSMKMKTRNRCLRCIQPASELDAQIRRTN